MSVLEPRLNSRLRSSCAEPAECFAHFKSEAVASASAVKGRDLHYLGERYAPAKLSQLDIPRFHRPAFFATQLSPETDSIVGGSRRGIALW